MNVLVLNSGSSTLKFQLIATDLGRISQNNDERLCRGQIERIGGEAIISVQTRNGLREKFTASISDILGALERLVRWIASDESGITEVGSTSDIHAVGHRVVHGGELFTDTLCPITCIDATTFVVMGFMARHTDMWLTATGPCGWY